MIMIFIMKGFVEKGTYGKVCTKVERKEYRLRLYDIGLQKAYIVNVLWAITGKEKAQSGGNQIMVFVSLLGKTLAQKCRVESKLEFSYSMLGCWNGSLFKVYL